MEGPESHECESDQGDADNQQPPIGVPMSKHESKHRRGDDDNQLDEHPGVSAGKKKIDDEAHNTNTNTYR